MLVTDFIGIKEVCQITGFCKKTIYNYINHRNFPKPVVKKGRNTKVLWSRRQVEEYLLSSGN